MKNVNIISINPYMVEEIEDEILQFTKGDYEKRITELINKMKINKITHSIIYGDREHFANIEFLTGYDPRYEETLLIISIDGDLTLLVGNEGWGYSFITPLNVNRVLYQNFSLQGQPRGNLVSLKEIFLHCGIDQKSKIGIIGFKYFEKEHIKDHIHRVDIPSYIIDELNELVDRSKIINFTYIMSHPEEGLRIEIRSPKEIAYFEYVSNKASNKIINILKGLKPGITELEASKNARYDAWPINVFPIVNFGNEHVKLGLRSPNSNELKEGDVITICYGARGSLIARSGIAVYDDTGIPCILKSSISEFYKPFFLAVVEWYESLHIGSNCGEVYDKVMSIIGDSEKFGVYLNPGHNTSTDEWLNSPFYEGSKIKMRSGYYLQSDIIASSLNPFKQAILEDGIILANEKLRKELKSKYPKVYGRIKKRRHFMKETIGINISDDVLPLSNCQAIYHPYMLNLNKIFTVDK